MLDYLNNQNNANPTPSVPKPTGSLMLDTLNDLSVAAPDDGVPPSPMAQPPVDPLDAQIARNNAFADKAADVLSQNVVDPLQSANQFTQQSDTSNNIETAMAMQQPPSAMVAPVQLGRDGVNPVSVFNPLPVDNAQIVRDEISKIEQQPMATQERADAGLFNPNRDFSRAFEFGGLRARSDVKNLVADAEDVLTKTAPMEIMQTMQNASLPVINPIRELFGAAPLPENANEKASIAAAAAARQDATRLMDQAKALGYRQMTTDDIDNFGDFLDWATTSLGSSGEPMIVALATGGWMSPLLMAGEYNTNLKEIKGLSKEKRLALASSGGLVAGFLENLGLGVLVKGIPKELVGKLGGKWFADKVSKHFGARIGAAVLTGMTSEGLVEGGQEGIGIGLEASVGKKFKQGEVWTRFKEAMAAGAVVGGGIRFGVQSGTEVASGVQSAITPDPLLTDNEKTVAEFIAIDTLNPANAQLNEVETEGEPTGSLLLDAIQKAEGVSAPVVDAPDTSNINETTSTQVSRLQQKAAEAVRLAQATEGNIKAAEGKALDLDSKRDEEFRTDAEQYAKTEREKAEKLTQQAQELQQFYATPEGQRYAAEIEAIQKEADAAGIDVNIAARLNTVPREDIDAAIEFARGNLEFNRKTEAAKAGNAPPIPNTPVTDPAELLAPLEGRQTKAAEGSFISQEEKQLALETVNKLNKQLNDMGFELGQSLNTANSTEEARNLRTELIMAIGVYNELQSQRLARDKGHKNFVPARLSSVEADFTRIFGSAKPAPAVDPEPEVDTAAAIERLRQDPDVSPQTAPATEQSFTPLETLKLDYAKSEKKYVEPVANPDAVTDDEYNRLMAKAIESVRFNIPFIVSNGILAEKTKIEEVIRRADQDGILIDRSGIILNAEKFASAYQVNPQAQPVISFARPVADTDGQQKTVSIATPDNEVTVQAKPVILDAAYLKAATGNLQPRDRSLDESAVEVQRRAANLDPARLLDSPTSDNGAPIVARDGTIISGNGRVLSLRAVYEQFPEQAAAYKQAIAEYGASDANYANPVLVMMLDQDMSFEQLADFADRSNRSAIATMSATERAQRDAQAMDIEMVNMFQGGSMTAIENQGFVQQFMRSVVAPTEQNQMSRDGRLTKEGVQRMESAILATAYEDTDALAIMLDSTDDNIKAISRAMLDAAPSFAKLKADIAAGEVNGQFDISSKVTEAARKISDLRNRGVKPRDFFAQQDAFNQVDPDVEALIRAFYNEELTRAKSQRIMSDVLKFYTEEAAQKKQGGFFEDTTTPRDVIELARRKADGTEGQGDLLSDTKQRTSRSLNESSQQTQRTAPKRSGQGLKEADTASIKARLDNAERTRRAEVASEETVGTTEDSVLAVSDLDSQRTEKPGTLVDKVSMRRYSSLQGQAFRDAGIDPALGKNMPIERQFKILSDLVKNKFGLAHVVKTDKANKKEAVDQLLAGYHNLNNLAYELELPTQAMGLGGTLSFVAAADTGAYGTYSPSEQTITLPRRSNSFAHEWFHALDHYLLEKYGSGETTKMPLATEAVRKYGNEAFAPDAPTGVKEAYFSLMRALFKDKASEAAQLMAIDQKMAGMEQRAAKSGKDVSAMPTYQKLKAQKQRILESTGKSRKVGKSQMRKDAEFFAEIIDQGADYWASPAEMGARAFEAFAINKVTNAGLQTAFLGKTDEAYTTTLEQLGVTRKALATPETVTDMLAVLDSRLALTFPKSDERANIFGAMQNLMEAIRLETELGQGDKAELIGNDFVTDMRDLHKVPEKESKGILADYKQARTEAKNLAEREKSKVSQYTERYKGKKKAIVGEKGFVIPMKHFAYIEDTVMAPLFYQKQGILKAMIKRYPDNRRLKRIYQKLGTHTGGELQSTYEGDTLFNAQARQVRIFSERMKNAVVGAEYNTFTQEEVTQLRDILISEDNVGASPKVIKLAGQLRDIYNNMYDYLRKNGLDIGYAPNGYVQRILDHAEVSNDPALFETQARKVYDIVWEQDLGAINEGDLDQMLATVKYIQDARLGIEEFDQQTGEKITLGNRSDYKKFVESTAWKDIKDLLGALKVEQKKESPDQAQIDSLNAELELQAANIATEFEQFYNAMQRHFSRMKAINYRQSINHSHVGGSQDGSPQASFTKKRKLPPEADKLMEQFYISDPVENLTNYILGAVRKAEYNKRFGKHLIPAPANKNNYTDLLDYELKQLTDRDGITATEVNEIENAISNMLGRNMDGKMPTMLQKGANRAAAALSITLLIRAPIASIAEPFTVAMTSGSVKKGLMSFASTMQEFPGLRNLGNAQEDIRIRHQFARIMGVIDDPEVGDIMTNRIGGEFAGDPKVSKIMASFFAKIKLSGITNAQRRSAAKIGFQYITEMAYEIQNPSSMRNQKQARLVMKDLGVADSRMAQFVDYVLSFNEHNDKGNFVGKMKLPTANEVFANESGEFSDMGLQLAVSIMRFTDQSIQDPRTVDRPLWAENGIGRIVYGITSFIYSFQDKVLKPMYRRTAREYEMSRSEGKSRASSGMDAGTAAALNAAIPLTSLFTAHALVSTAREYIFNQDRWDREWEEADEDELKFIGNYLLPLAFTRSGLTGAFDPLFQAFTGLKYQRDIANTFLGTGGYVAQNFQDIAKYWVNNSENTVSNEFKALRGIYNLTVNPFASLLLATSNLTPATAYVGTGAAMAVTSTDFKNAVINRWLNYYYGQTYTPGVSGRKSKSFDYTNK